MDNIDQPRFTVSELADATGVSTRNIRYYTQQGLVPNAAGKGRSRHYTAVHVEQLTMVRDLRDRGLSIDEIREALTPAPPPAASSGEAWTRIPLRDDLEIHIRQDAPQAVHELTRLFQKQHRSWLGGDEDDTF